jgi:methylated-DNA-protein-cysteine methyltransferase related protein
MGGGGRGARRGRGEKRVHGDVQATGRGAWEAVYAIARGIPPGRVMTYGQISGLLGHVISPLAVGWAMHVCPDDVPWHRVVNAAGKFSTERLPDLPPDVQRRLLEAEGIELRLDGSLDLARYRWEGVRTAPQPATKRRRARG